MAEYIVNRPDEEVMRRILQQNPDNAVGAILRLAWQAGLLREEIQTLTWAQIDFQDRRIVLPDREVPLEEELADWLETLRRERNRTSEAVVLSDRDRKPLTPQSISRLVRSALDKEGQTKVRLIDLRHDYVLRQLARHDWQYVSRITGMEAAALNAHFGTYMKEKHVSTRAKREETVHIDEFALWKLLQAEKMSPAGVALWLTWQMGLRLDEIVALTWDQVDLQRQELHLPERTVAMTSGVLGVLRQLREKTPASRKAVVAAPRTGHALDRTRLSKLTRAALVRGGMDDVTLRDLRVDCEIRVGGENQVVSWVRRHQYITRNQAMELLGVSRTTAYNRLKQMVQRGKLTQIGTRYYLFGQVVPPERQPQVILEYLTREGFAYRQDIAQLLHVDPRQCRPILRRMVENGQIVQEKQRYTLKQA